MVRRYLLIFAFLPLGIWFLLCYFLRGETTWLLPSLFCIIPLFGFVETQLPKGKKWMRMGALLLLLVFSVLLIMEILMMPYQAYKLWFELLNRGIPRGRVSQLFMKLGSLLSALIVWRFFVSKNFLKDALYLPCFFLFLLFPSLWLGLICLALIILPLIHRKMSGQFYVLLVCSMLLALTSWKAEPRGIRWIDSYSGNMGQWVEDTFPNLPLVYQIPLYGQSLSTRVQDGGKPVLSSQLLLKITGQPRSRVYLRTKIYRDINYKGQMMEFGQLLRREDLTDYQGTPMGIPLEITLQTDYMNLLPITENTRIIETGLGTFSWDFPSHGLIWSDPPLVYEETFRLYLDPQSPLLEEDLEHYQSPPPRASEEMIELALSLQGRSTDATIDNIRTYLRGNHSYSLETQGEEDFVESFLFETREGYCLHFATAFVQLARLNSIPCRLAEGYLAYLPGEEVLREGGTPGEAWISGYSAHSWPEVYYPEKGWTRIEVTPPYLDQETLDNIYLDDSQQLLDPMLQVDGSLRSGRTISIPYLPLAILLFILLCFFIFWRLRKAGNEHPILKKLKKMGIRKGLPNPSESGWDLWIHRWQDQSQDDLKNLRKAILRCRYSETPLNADEVKEMDDARKKLRRFRAEVD